jgi:L-amino acid N-acyltransferase YncA
MKILTADSNHFSSIVKIYNWAILNTTATFDTEIISLNQYLPFLKSFNTHESSSLPLIVIINENEVLGWGCLKPYSDRAAYNETVELSIYIHCLYQGRGIGKLLMANLIKRAKQLNKHTVLSRVTTDSLPSIKLHERYGFKNIGIMKEVGFKFGRRCDVAFMQLLLRNSTPA